MSRGPGKIERAIRELFDANPDQAFTTDDLIELCYPAACPERKHRVAVQRAAHNVMRLDTRDWEGQHAGVFDNNGLLIYCNRTSVRSVAIAEQIAIEAYAVRERVGVGYWAGVNHHLNGRLMQPALAQQMAPGGRYHQLVQEYLANPFRPPPPVANRAEQRERHCEWLWDGAFKGLEVLARIYEAQHPRPMPEPPPVSDVQPQTTLAITVASLAELAAFVRGLTTQNDPDVVRQELTEIAEMLEKLVGATPEDTIPAEPREER